MITLFTVPKPFRGHIATIQRNAIQSWTRLRPRPEIILLCDDEGTREAAAEFGARYVPEVARNEYGTPLVNDIFDKAQRLATHRTLCYVNADIILMSGFIGAVRRVMRRRFLMVGQRWDLNVKEALDFAPGWEEDLRRRAVAEGRLHGETGIDYFAFPWGLWQHIPPFALGRAVWDNWLIYEARRVGASVIDATKAVTIVHQNHDYAHISGRITHIDQFKGLPERKRNLKLAGGASHAFSLLDAPLALTRFGAVLPKMTPASIERRRETFPVLHPRPSAWRRCVAGAAWLGDLLCKQVPRLSPWRVATGLRRRLGMGPAPPDTVRSDCS